MSFQQGLSGLNATSKNLEVIGNNIANSSTYGAKASRAEFADVYAAALNGAGTNTIGIGVNLAAVTQQFTQGNISTTDNPMDLAINGSGFFQVTDGASPTQYTRNGQFSVDRNGFVVNNQGLRLMGYPADGTGVIQPGSATALQLPTAGIDPKVTEDITLELNLDSRQSVTTPASGAPITFTDPTTYNNATSMTVYDEKGQDVALTYYFQKTADDAWDIYLTANGTSVSVDGAGDPVAIGSIGFASDGSTPTTTPDPMAINITTPITNASGANIVVPLNMTLDLSGATQYGANFGVTNVAQDGYSAGQLTGITIEDTGIVTARYSNGQSKSAGQIEIATFRNPQGLQPLGGNSWAATFSSGDPVKGTPGDGNLGVLQSGALEDSNVDLTAELVNMITAQRVYQANAQTIKTEDAMMQTLVNLR